MKHRQEEFAVITAVGPGLPPEAHVLDMHKSGPRLVEELLLGKTTWLRPDNWQGTERFVLLPALELEDPRSFPQAKREAAARGWWRPTLTAALLFARQYKNDCLGYRRIIVATPELQLPRLARTDVTRSYLLTLNKNWQGDSINLVRAERIRWSGDSCAFAFCHKPPHL